MFIFGNWLWDSTFHFSRTYSRSLEMVKNDVQQSKMSVYSENKLHPFVSMAQHI